MKTWVSPFCCFLLAIIAIMFENIHALFLFLS